MNNKLEKFEAVATSVGALFRYQEDDEGEPMIDARLGKLIEVGSAALSKSLRMSFLGGLSGQARVEKGLKGAIALDVVENKMPLINLVGDFMGINTKQYITKHPEALAQIYSMIPPGMLKGFNLGNDGGSNPGSREGVGYG